MTSSRTVSPLVPVAAFVFALAHIGFEYFNGGVKTHHFLARADLPGFSNWLGLLVLPLLGGFLAIRIKSLQGRQASGIFQRLVAAGLLGSLVYGAALAASFHFGLPEVSKWLFMGLFLCSIVLPVYRAEYMLGFVVGMTITFGSVIPLTFALVFATISFVLRGTAMLVLSALRKLRR